MRSLAHPYSFGRAYIILDLPDALFERLPMSLSLNGEAFLRRTRFHISLLCLKATVPMLGERLEFSDTEIDRILELFESYVSQNPIMLEEFLSDIRFVEKDTRASVVVRCCVSNLEGFFARCESELGFHVPPMPTHVTLFTREENAGIGVNTYPEMEKLPRLDIPEIRTALDLS